MSGRPLLALVALAFASACLDPSTLSPAPDAGRPPVKPLDCLRMPDQIDFGEVDRRARSDKQFFISNNTLKPLTIEVGQIEEPFFTTFEGRMTIASGERFPLRLSFLPRDGRLQVTTFQFIGGEGCAAQVVELRGIGSGELIGESTFFDFGPVPINQRVGRTFTLTNTRRTEVVGSVTLFGTAFSAPTAFTIPALGVVELDLGVTVTGPGLFNGALEIATTRGDQLRVGLAASGGVPQLKLDRDSLRINLLPMPIDATRFPLFLRTIRLSNEGEGELRVQGFSVRANPGSDVDELSVVFLNTTIVAGSPNDLLVHFRPHAVTGPRSWSIRFATNQPNRPVVEIPITAEVVSLAACGGAMITNPSISVPASSLPVTAQLTISNPFPTPCLVDDVKLAPAEWALNSGDQILIPGNGNTQLDVTIDHPGASLLLFNAVGGGVGYQSVSVRTQ